jgi:hypothetical protein
MSTATPPLGAWVIRRLVVGQPLNGEISQLTGTLRQMADYLDGLPVPERQPVLDGMAAIQADPNELIRAVAAADPTAPAPVIDPLDIVTAADLRQIIGQTVPLWPGWIPAASVTGIVGLEGIGKTRYALDICRRVRNTDEWPDKQAMSLPQPPSLWLCSDGQQTEILQTAEQYGLDGDAIVYTGTSKDINAYSCLDDDDTWKRLDDLISKCSLWALFIDSPRIPGTLAGAPCNP